MSEDDREPLRDITNIQPLQLGTPPRRSVSAPVSSAALSPLPSYLSLQRTPHSPLTHIERAAVAVLTADGQSTSVIAQKLQTTPKTIKRWRSVAEDDDELTDDYRSGRSYVLTSIEMEAIVDHAIINPKTTPKEIKALLNLDCHPRTIRRVLDEAGLFGRITREAPPLKEEHLKKRLAYAEGYSHWTTTGEQAHDWMRVLWTDEMSIHIGPQGQHWCQRLLNTEWEPSHVMEKQKHPPKLHVWGGFSGLSGVEDIYTFEENLDSEGMLKILKSTLHTSSATLKQKGQWWFQQDNDPKHKSKLIQNYLKQQGIDCIEWPPYSPDLNPIENVWAYLKKQVEKENATTVAELKEAVVKCWQEIPHSLCTKLVESIPRRLNAIVQNRGCMTGY